MARRWVLRSGKVQFDTVMSARFSLGINRIWMRLVIFTLVDLASCRVASEYSAKILVLTVSCKNHIVPFNV